MKKLETIDVFLKSKDNIYIGKVLEDDCFSSPLYGFIQNVDYFVAPKHPKKDVFDMEKFMLSLIPQDLTPTSIEVFRQYNSDIKYGNLIFEDIIGSVARTDIYVSDDSYIIKKLGGNGKVLENNTIMNSYNLKRRITILPFPSKNILTNVLNGKLGASHITTDNLNKYIGK